MTTDGAPALSVPVTVRTSRGRLPLPARNCDCSQCDFYLDNPDAAEPLCGGCNTDCEYCSCLLHLSGRDDACDQCPVVCGSRVRVEQWMIEARGTLRFDDITFGDLRLPDTMPRFIPVVDTNRVAELDDGLGWPAYAVRLRSVVSPHTHKITPSFTDRTAHEALGLQDGQLAVLTGYDQDPLVEAVWTRRNEIALAFAAQKWDLVVGPDLSVYGSSPRFDQLLNMRRQLLLTRLFTRVGITAAPNLSWFRLEDLRRLEDLLARTRPAAVAINLQLQRQPRAWNERLFPGLAYLASGFPPETCLIVCGPSRRDRIAELRRLFPNLMLLSQNATIYARKRVVMTPRGREERPQTAVSTCFAESAHYYNSILN